MSYIATLTSTINITQSRLDYSRLTDSTLTAWPIKTTLISQTGQIRGFHPYLRAIMPEPADEELTRSIDSPSSLTKLDTNGLYLSLAVYLISNNMSSSELCNRIIDHMQNQIDGRAVRALLPSRQRVDESRIFMTTHTYRPGLEALLDNTGGSKKTET